MKFGYIANPDSFTGLDFTFDPIKDPDEWDAACDELSRVEVGEKEGVKLGRSEGEKIQHNMMLGCINLKINR